MSPGDLWVSPVSVVPCDDPCLSPVCPAVCPVSHAWCPPSVPAICPTVRPLSLCLSWCIPCLSVHPVSVCLPHVYPVSLSRVRLSVHPVSVYPVSICPSRVRLSVPLPAGSGGAQALLLSAGGGVHRLADGLALGSAFVTSGSAGAAAGAGLALHELPRSLGKGRG